MSTNRVSRGGWVNPGKLPIGPGGRTLCRRCGQEVPKDRRTFCSKGCVHEWRLRTDPSYVRLKVFERDRGVCGGCGADTQAKRSRGTGNLWQADHIVPVVEGGGECGIENYRTLCTECHKRETAALRKRLAISRSNQGVMGFL